ncbi:MAG: TlpA family protein disulfide reductase [Actinobacteria bacterium]|nr:TlpA family protein disulfide reductase [Actinomycetota bacterium]
MATAPQMLTMTDSTDKEPVPAAASRPRPRFDPRRALLLCLGAFVIVLLFAAVMAFFVDDGSQSTSKGPTASIDGGTIKLGADDSTFTATTLPPTGLVTMDGTVTSLDAVVGGKPTVINMFSSSCTACRTEMPALEKMHRSIGDKVRFVGVNLGDSQGGTADFVKQTGVTYTIVRDPQQRLVTPLNITAQPMTLWVDAKGRITGHRYGALTTTEMRLAMKDYLGIDLPAG